MENQTITNELRARIFAAYYGAGCEMIRDRDNYNLDDKVSAMAIARAEGSRYESIKLILTPLSQITDEHAIEVAKIARMKYTDDKDLLITGKNISANVESVWLEEPFLFNYIEIIDFLRSKNYDLGHGDIPSLIEAGVAISSPSNKTV